MNDQHRLTAEEQCEQIKKWGHINHFLNKDPKEQSDFNHYKVRDKDFFEREGYTNNTNVNRHRRYDIDNKNIFKSIKKELEANGFFNTDKTSN